MPEVNYIELEREIPENPENPFRLGRHVLHDERSRAHRVSPVAAAELESRSWQRAVGIFNQGNLGSCTGNAAVGSAATSFVVSGTAYAGLGVMSKCAGCDKQPIDQSTCVAVYSRATEIDPFRGTYPPTDTGSNGLSVAKALQEFGVIDEYQHAFGLNDLVSALQTGPAILGTNWYSSMFYPTNGVVSISPNSTVDGGHEYEAIAVDLPNKMFTFANSWGTGWGSAGYFDMSFATVDRLLHEDGDVTVFRPKVVVPPLVQPCSWIQTLLRKLFAGHYVPNCN